MTSDLLREGFTQGAILPTTLIIDIAPQAVLVDTGGTPLFYYDYTTGDSVNRLTLAGSPASASLLNESPAKYAIDGDGDGLDILVPGVYNCEISLELESTGGVSNLSFACVPNVAAPTPFYVDQTTLLATRQIESGGFMTYTRKFVVDTEDPVNIKLMMANRKSAAGTLNIIGGQFTITRTSKYVTTVRT